MVTIIWQKAASHMDGSVIFARWRQCAPPSNTCFFGATRVHIPNCIWIDSYFFCTAHGREPLYFTIVRPFPRKIALLHAISGSPSKARFLGPTRVHKPNGISIGSATFAGSQSWQTDRPRYWVCTGNNRPYLVVLWCSLIKTVCEFPRCSCGAAYVCRSAVKHW